eukprot:2237036-Pleurochrysis_carterae.AAC.1
MRNLTIACKRRGVRSGARPRDVGARLPPRPRAWASVSASASAHAWAWSSARPCPFRLGFARA